MVSAAKLRRAQDRVIAARPYAQQMLRVLNSLASRVESSVHPLLAQPAERSRADAPRRDHGGQGALRELQLQPHQERVAVRQPRSPDRQIALGLIGRKGRDFFRRRRGFDVRDEHVGLFAALKYSHAQADCQARDRASSSKDEIERLSGLQRVQERDDPARGHRAASADCAPRRRSRREAPRRPARRLHLRARADAHSERRSCRSTSKRKSIARCSSRQPPSTRRA